MIVKRHNEYNALIATNSQSELKWCQEVMDGRKVRSKNQIIVPLKSLVHLEWLKETIEFIKFEDDMKDITNSLIKKKKMRMANIGILKSKSVEFDYDYKGPYDVMAHQKIMYNAMMYTDACAILGDPGTGKTLSYIMAIDKKIQLGKVKRTLIVTLSSLKKNVHIEVGVQAPHLSSIYLKDKEHSDRVLNKRFKNVKRNIDYDIYIANYESMNVLKDLIPVGFFDMVILDEAHRVGSPSTNQTKAIIDTFENVKYKYIATGTLVANNLMSFYMPFRFMGADTIPYSNYYTFRSQYMRTVDPDKRIWVPLAGSNQKVTEIIGGLSVQFRKEDCLDLPDLIFKKVYCTMSKDQKKTYNTAKEKMSIQIDSVCNECEFSNECDRKTCINDDFIIDNALVLARKLHQLASGFFINSKVVVDDNGNEKTIKKYIDFEIQAKLSALIDVINEIPKDRKVIIWTSYTHSVETIRDKLMDKYGSDSVVTGYQSQDSFGQVELFKDKKVRFLVANTTKMGTGLNIQFSNYQIFYDNSFSFVVRDQAIGRQHRKGQDNKVTVYDLITSNTIDEHVIEVLDEKKDLSITLTQLAKILK